MEIATASRSQIKLLQKLKLKKYRQKYGSFVVEGRKVVLEIIEDKFLEIKSLYATEEWLLTNRTTVDKLGVEAHLILQKDLKLASSFVTPDGVMAICSTPKPTLPGDLKNWLLYLDGISDPGNLGTIIRTADWFGISEIVLSPGTVDYLNPKCIQASMGSVGRVQVHYIAFDKIRAKYSDCPLLLADSRGASPRKI